MPYFTPAIYKFRLAGGRAELVERITIKGRDGRDITGISNPLVTTDTEGAYDAMGKKLPLDPSGLDTEGLVKMPDGTFWAAEEYAPSMVHIARDGRIIARYVPKGIEKDLKNADYKVIGSLPSILMKRKLNRGMESMAVDPAGRYVYAALQSPLCNPDAAAYKAGRLIRIIKMSAGDGRIIGEYVYQMDEPSAFVKDNEGKKVVQSAVKVSEMAGLGRDRLLVLERVSKTTKFYEIDLTHAQNILGSKYDSRATSPSLEQYKTAADAKITPVKKTLVFNTDDHPGFMAKIEGIALLGKNRVLLVNDNDFGIDGSETKMVLTTMPLGQ